MEMGMSNNLEIIFFLQMMKHFDIRPGNIYIYIHMRSKCLSPGFSRYLKLPVSPCDVNRWSVIEPAIRLTFLEKTGIPKRIYLAYTEICRNESINKHAQIIHHTFSTSYITGSNQILETNILHSQVLLVLVNWLPLVGIALLLSVLGLR